MNLNEYLEKQGVSAVSLADKINVDPVLISQWRHGVRQIPVARCVDLEKATGGAITRQKLRPLDFDKIWPELLNVR